MLLTSKWDVLSEWRAFFGTLLSPTDNVADSGNSEVAKILLYDRVRVGFTQSSSGTMWGLLVKLLRNGTGGCFQLERSLPSAPGSGPGEEGFSA